MWNLSKCDKRRNFDVLSSNVCICIYFMESRDYLIQPMGAKNNIKPGGIFIGTMFVVNHY
jgi:hypothetical protein